MKWRISKFDDTILYAGGTTKVKVALKDRKIMMITGEIRKRSRKG